MNRIKLFKEKSSQLNELKSFRTLKSYNYQPKNYNDYIKILKIKSDNKDPNLNDIDVTLLDRVGGFFNFDFFEDNNFYVDEWDVSYIKNFHKCFYDCFEFNCDLSNWDVSNGVDFYSFFSSSKKFNKQINHFDLYNAKNLYYFLFKANSFNQPLDRFKFNYNIDSLLCFFEGCFVFNQDVSMWDVSNIKHFDFMFYETKNFLQDLSKWNVSKAERWNFIFKFSKMANHPELIPEKFRKDYNK